MATGSRGLRKARQRDAAANHAMTPTSVASAIATMAVAPVPPGPFVDYWQLRMEGVFHRLRAAKSIIAHTGTRGSLAESLLGELAAEFLPRRWAVGTGFILDSQRRVSRQVDILIYDAMTSSPVYQDGDLVVLAPGTARLAIEVKSDLSGKGIRESLENIRSVKELDPNVYGMVFGYDGVKADAFAGHVADWFGSAAGMSAKGARQIPNRFYNMEREFLVLDAHPDPTKAVAAGITYWAFQAPVRIPRFFLTELLGRLPVDNLSDFLPADEVGAELRHF